MKKVKNKALLKKKSDDSFNSKLYEEIDKSFKFRNKSNPSFGKEKSKRKKTSFNNDKKQNYISDDRKKFRKMKVVSSKVKNAPINKGYEKKKFMKKKIASNQNSEISEEPFSMNKIKMKNISNKRKEISSEKAPALEKNVKKKMKKKKKTDISEKNSSVSQVSNELNISKKRMKKMENEVLSLEHSDASPKKKMKNKYKYLDDLRAKGANIKEINRAKKEINQSKDANIMEIKDLALKDSVIDMNSCKVNDESSIGLQVQSSEMNDNVETLLDDSRNSIESSLLSGKVKKNKKKKKLMQSDKSDCKSANITEIKDLGLKDSVTEMDVNVETLSDDSKNAIESSLLSGKVKKSKRKEKLMQSDKSDSKIANIMEIKDLGLEDSVIEMNANVETLLDDSSNSIESTLLSGKVKKNKRKERLMKSDEKDCKKMKLDLDKLNEMLIDDSNAFNQSEESYDIDELKNDSMDEISPMKVIDNESSTDIPKKKPKRLMTFSEKAREKLKGAQFRYLNEQLYTMTGVEALKVMSKDSASFYKYHDGYDNQVKVWPINPVDKVIHFLKNGSSKLTIADFGCGSAKIAQSVKNKTHSFDLVALNEYVTACNMSDVPIASNTIDIGVFCLSLMNTDFIKFLVEANRVMKEDGKLVIVELQSRFDSIKEFIRKMKLLGFLLIKKEFMDKMFIWLQFYKSGNPKSELPPIELKPCLYKKR